MAVQELAKQEAEKQKKKLKKEQEDYKIKQKVKESFPDFYEEAVPPLKNVPKQGLKSTLNAKYGGSVKKMKHGGRLTTTTPPLSGPDSQGMKVQKFRGGGCAIQGLKKAKIR